MCISAPLLSLKEDTYLHLVSNNNIDKGRPLTWRKISKPLISQYVNWLPIPLKPRHLGQNIMGMTLKLKINETKWEAEGAPRY